MHRRRPSSVLNWRSNSTVAVLVGAIFFVVLVASNHYSDFNLLAFSASHSPYMASSRVQASIQTCDNTKQGKYWVTDDRGYVCKRQNLLGNGCCKITDDQEQFSCMYCNETAECCVEYEYCISCCLQPSNQIAINSMKMVQDNPIFQSTSNFAFCQARCRTSSESLVYDNEYRSNHKFCYGTKGPSKDADLNMDTAKYQALYADRGFVTQDSVKMGMPAKKTIQDDLINDVLPAFLEVGYDSNNLDLMPVNGDIQANNPMLFGILGGEQFAAGGETSAGSSLFRNGRYYILFVPLFFVLCYAVTFWTIIPKSPESETDKAKIE